MNFIKISLVLLFFLHGVLYFLYPEDLHNISSVIKLIKYILIVLFALFFSLKVKFRKIFNSALFFIVFLSFYMISNSFEISEKLILFLIPFLFMYMFIAEFNHHLIIKLTVVIYLITSIFSYVEYFFLNGIFSRFGFGDFGYRISSIYINPNNCGITMLFISIYMLENSKNKIFNTIIYINTFLVVLLTISKTAMLLFFAYVLFKFFRQGIFILIVIGSVLLLYVDTTIDVEVLLSSFRHRNEYNSLFLNLANENVFFPFLNFVQYTDNIYLQVWGYFGFLVATAFVIFNMLIMTVLFLKRDYVKLFTLILFILTGVTTNFLYTWPLSYMYWGFIFYVLHTQIKNWYSLDVLVRGRSLLKST